MGISLTTFHIAYNLELEIMLRRNKVELGWTCVIRPRSGDLMLYYCLHVIFCAGGMSVKRTGHAEFFLEIKEDFSIKNYFEN